jgi:hypothetical protein
MEGFFAIGEHYLDFNDLQACPRPDIWLFVFPNTKYFLVLDKNRMLS